MTHLIAKPCNTLPTQAPPTRQETPFQEPWTREALSSAMSGGDGRIIPFKKGLDMLRRFEGSPKSHEVSVTVLQQFRDKCRQMQSHPGFPSHFEMAWRLYLGIDPQQQYQVVIVPVAGPTAQPGENRNFTHDWEVDLFKKTETPFFALVPSQNAILYDLELCRQILGRVDASGIEGLSLLHAHAERFFKGLSPDSFNTFNLGFARNEENKLTLVSVAQDKEGEPLRSTYTDPRTGMEISGYWWDDTGMFPPPPPWRHNTYFNRS